MVKTLMIALAATTLAAGAPAQARAPYQDARAITPARNAEIRSQINGLDGAIARATQHRTISTREARGLRTDARNIQRLYASYARGGLSRDEVQSLQTRVNRVRVALRMERLDWNGRRG